MSQEANSSVRHCEPHEPPESRLQEKPHRPMRASSGVGDQSDFRNSRRERPGREVGSANYLYTKILLGFTVMYHDLTRILLSFKASRGFLGGPRRC